MADDELEPIQEPVQEPEQEPEESEKKKRSCLAISMLVYTSANVVIALGLIASGSWMHASQDTYSYICVFVRSSNDALLAAAAALLLVAGIILFILSVLGIYGTWKEHQTILIWYMWLLTFVIVLGLMAGFMCVGLYYDIHRYVKNGMLEQLSDHYAWESRLGMEWNRVQVKKRCCGVDGSWDYEVTEWFIQQNPVDEPVTVFVPDSCCVLNFNQDRDLYQVNPQELQLKDAVRCQEDAEGKVSNSANLHMKGCFAALFQINPDLFNDVTIFSVMFVIEGLGLCAGFLQLFGMTLTFFYIAELRRNKEQEEEEIGLPDAEKQ